MRYEEYKDSGIEWLGEVPSHWTVCKVKHKYSFKTGATPSSGKKEFYDGEIKWANISDINGGIIHDTVKHITDEAVRSCSMTISPKGSLLYSFKLSVGQVAFCGDDMYTNEAITTFESNTQNLRYLYYIAPQFIIHNANRNIYNAPLLNQDLIKNALIVLPPIEEQLAIASYLDEKCGKINGAIDVQKKKIDLLNELKQTIITNAVTKGLNPDAPMKDSGVEWIGKVPMHWEVMKTSLAFLGIGSGTTPSTCRKEYYTEGDGLYWLQTGDLNDGEITDTSKKITSLAADECNLKFYPTDSVVIAMYGATIGKVGLLKISTSTNQACCVLPKSKRCIPAFAFYLFIGAKKQLLIDAMGGGQPNISQDIIKKLKVSIPPISEQRIIVDHIADEVSRIDAQISKANRRIELLNELKQSVITEAVTGKIKVC